MVADNDSPHTTAFTVSVDSGLFGAAAYSTTSCVARSPPLPLLHVIGDSTPGPGSIGSPHMSSFGGTSADNPGMRDFSMFMVSVSGSPWPGR